MQFLSYLMFCPRSRLIRTLLGGPLSASIPQDVRFHHYGLHSRSHRSSLRQHLASDAQLAQDCAQCWLGEIGVQVHKVNFGISSRLPQRLAARRNKSSAIHCASHERSVGRSRHSVDMLTARTPRQYYARSPASGAVDGWDLVSTLRT